MVTRKMALGVALAAAVGFSGPAGAQQYPAPDYPNKPITLVVAFSPGGSTDNLARVMVDRLSEELGQPVIVENRPGASGYVAWRSIADAEPDGYTVLLAENALAINTAMRPDEPLDPREDFEPIGRVGLAPMALVVNKDVPVETVEELVQYSKENEVNFASSGIGAVSHMTFEALADEVGIVAVHVPYRGGGESNAALAGGHVEAIMTSLGNAARVSGESRAKVLAVTAPERVEAFPEVPTLDELGIDIDRELRFWWGLFVPAGTPEPIKQELSDALEAVLQDPELLERMANIEVDAAFAPDEEMAEILDAEITNWRTFVEEKGIRPE